jgi:hypothetical protein
VPQLFRTVALPAMNFQIIVRLKANGDWLTKLPKY